MSLQWSDYFQKEELLNPFTRLLLHESKQSFKHFFTYDREFITAPYQEKIIDDLEDPLIQYLLVEMPREHGKSTIACESFAAHHLIFNPDAYVLIFSRTLKQAKKRGAAIKKIIKNDSKFRVLARSGKESWGQESFMLQNGALCELYGTGAEIAGAKHIEMRPTLIICDDIVHQKARSDLNDSSVIDWFNETVLSLGGEGCKVIVVGTPYRQTDVLFYLKSNPAFVKHHYEALLGKDLEALYIEGTEVLWPAVWPLKRLRKRFEASKKDKLTFTRQYLCRMVAIDEMLYKPSLIEKAKLAKLAIVPKRPSRYEVEQGRFPFFYESVVCAVDIAYSEEAAADFFVVYVLGITAAGRYHAIWIERHKGLSNKTQVALLTYLNTVYNFDEARIESNSAQIVLSQELEDTDLVVKEHYTTNEKQNEQTGLALVKINLDSERLFYPDADVDYKQTDYEVTRNADGAKEIIIHPQMGKVTVKDNFNVLYDEMGGWVWDGGKWVTVMAHDDTVLAQWMVCLTAKWFSYMLIDEPEESEKEE